MHEISYITQGLTDDFNTKFPSGTPHLYTSDGTTHTELTDSANAETEPGTIAVFDV
jgi:hypothetical protein